MIDPPVSERECTRHVALHPPLIVERRQRDLSNRIGGYPMVTTADQLERRGDDRTTMQALYVQLVTKVFFSVAESNTLCFTLCFILRYE